jgi:putative ABC transport system permease protein
VATPALLRSFGIRPSRVTADADVLTMRPGLAAEPRMQLVVPPSRPPGQAQSQDPCPASSCIANPVIETASGLPSGTSAPNTVITLRAVRALGLHEVASGWLIQAARPLTAGQISSARQLAAAAGATIETKSGEVSLSEILNGATAVGLLLALGVLVMTVGLIRSETGSDLRTLAPPGPAPRPGGPSPRPPRAGSACSARSSARPSPTWPRSPGTAAAWLPRSVTCRRWTSSWSWPGSRWPRR